MAKATKSKSVKAAKRRASPEGAGTTSSGPSHPGSSETTVAEVAEEHQQLAAAMPSNATKPNEFGYEHAVDPVPGATVSMPLEWSAVKNGLDPKRFTVRTAPALITKSNAWKNYDKAKRPLLPVLKKLVIR